METFTSSKTSIDPAKHVNFSYGMVLGADDFSQEFGYLSGRDQWALRDLFGYGTVCGLRVSTAMEGSPPTPRIHVSTGTAITPQGRLIHVNREQCAWLAPWAAIEKNRNDLQQKAAQTPGSPVPVYLVLSHEECLTDQRPIPGEPCRSEKELMAPSRVADHFRLDIVFDPPRQSEEDAVRDFLAGLLSKVGVSDSGVNSTSGMGEFAAWLSKAVRGQPAGSSPAIDFESITPPLGFNAVHPDVAPDYFRTALLIWVTELRKKLRPSFLGDWCGCGVDPSTETGTQPDERILLAELRLSFDSASGTVTVASQGEEKRPFMVSHRMLQEWMLLSTARAAGRTVPPPVAPPPPSPPSPPSPGTPTPDAASPVPMEAAAISCRTVAAGCFDGSGNAKGKVYNALTVTVKEEGVFSLYFNGYRYQAEGGPAYVVKGTPWLQGSVARKPRAIFEVVEFSAEGIVVSLLTHDGKASPARFGFMVEITSLA